MYKIIIFLFSSLLYSNCSDNLFEIDFSDEEMEIVNECKANAINDLDVLRNNLIGKWQIYSFACHGCQEPSIESKESLELFSDGTGIGCDPNVVCNDLTWSLTETEEGNFMISATPANARYRIINVFCENYMIMDSETATTIFKKE